MSYNAQSSSASPIVQSGITLQPLLRQVYTWMTLAMLTTAASALAITQFSALSIFIENPVLLIIVGVVQLGLVIALNIAASRALAAKLAIALFFLYATSVGVTIALVLAVYSGITVVSAFATTALLFFVMTMMGLTTSWDLSKWSSYLFMGLIGLVLAMVVNLFLGNGLLEIIISMVAVVIFTALTAYDTQNIRKMADDPALQAEGSDTLTRLSIMGALHLYLNFMNLFLHLLRLFAAFSDD